MDVRMPDGTIISNVPEGTTKQQLLQKLELHKQSAPRKAIEEETTESFPGAMFIEPAAKIASSVVAEPIAGLAGLVSLPSEGVGGATKAIEATREGLTYKPRTEAGEKGMGTVSDLIEAGIDIVNFPLSGIAGLVELATGQGVQQAAETVKQVQQRGLGKAFGQRVMEETGSPELAAAAETAPTAALTLFPLAKIKAKRTAFKEKIAERINAGETAGDLSKYMISGKGKVKIDMQAKEAIKQGFDESVITAVKGATPVDRAKMQAMTNVLKKSKDNALYGIKNRPTDVAGNTLMERVKRIKKVNTSAGRRLDGVAKSLKGKPGSFDDAVNAFASSLDDMGVSIGKNLKPNFNGSDIEGLTAPQNAINNIVRRMSLGKRGKTPDAYDMHRLKKYIDENVTFGKAGEGLAGKTEFILKKLRRDVDSALDSQFPEYNKVNTEYADTISALDSLQGVAGKKIDLYGANADKAIGTLLRRMMGNAQSRVNLIDAVDEIEGIAKKYGGKFKDDVSVQMLYADELDNVFGPSTRTSFKAEIGKEINRAAAGVSKESLVVDAAGKAIEKLKGINEDSAFKAIEEILKR